jgi:hypothetical protein
MFRKIILIIFIISIYIFLVTSDQKGDLLNKLKSFCNYCIKKYKDMDLEYQINKWPKN